MSHSAEKDAPTDRWDYDLHSGDCCKSGGPVEWEF